MYVASINANFWVHLRWIPSILQCKCNVLSAGNQINLREHDGTIFHQLDQQNSGLPLIGTFRLARGYNMKHDSRRKRVERPVGQGDRALFARWSCDWGIPGHEEIVRHWGRPKERVREERGGESSRVKKRLGWRQRSFSPKPFHFHNQEFLL